MLRRILTVFSVTLAAAGAAQTLTLEQAVEQAVEQSLEAQQAQLQVQQAEIDLRQARAEQYPEASFQTNAGYQFGLGVDPTTNTLQQQQIFFASPSLGVNAVLYQGGRIRASIAQGKTQVSAAEATADDIRQDVALAMAQQYLEALLAREEVTAARARLADLTAQVDRVTRLIDAGQAAPVDRFPLESERARADQAVIVATNQLELAELRLRQLLRMEPSEALSLVRPESIDFDRVQLATAATLEIYQAALSRQPAIRAAELNEEVASQGIQLARSGYYPSLSAFGQLNTRYSSEAREPAGMPSLRVDEQTVFVDGMPVTLGFQQPVFDFQTIGVGQQFRDFFGQSVGLALNVPIFNNGRTNAAVQRAKVGLERARLNTAQERQRLEVEVSQALQAARGARAEVAASERALEAARASLRAAQRRSELGQGSAYDLANAQILLEQAQTAFLRARYQFLFNAKVVDFYLGRPLTLN